ncbi:cbb3-type cytochrome c oxidase subunit 3 [Pontixanthobacter aquaemixtae]|uniref:cbb3-type cytochrome c oxidase subunit 3 n=1 Tax=Pontixanthobacter aquaemixtae TaxID=1958940 RepID=UPI0038B608CD
MYETLRHFADSYGLAVMVVLYLALAAWPFRPGAREHNQSAANSIFKDDNDGE